jgi:hypothetical protein
LSGDQQLCSPPWSQIYGLYAVVGDCGGALGGAALSDVVALAGGTAMSLAVPEQPTKAANATAIMLSFIVFIEDLHPCRRNAAANAAR